MHTTITINGPDATRFLAFLGDHLSAVLESSIGGWPPALASLVRGRAQSVVVEADVAEKVASLVERFLSEYGAGGEPPVLFAPHVGDQVTVVRDVLVEFQAPARRAPRTWRFLPRGTRGRLIAHQGDTDRVLVEPSREIAYVQRRNLTSLTSVTGRFLRQ